MKRMRSAQVLSISALLGAAVPAAGCRRGCTGPGCDGTFNAGLIAVHLGDDDRGRGLVEPLESWASLRGGEDLGPNLAAALTPDTLWIGSPRLEAVTRVGLRGGAGLRLAEMPAASIRTTRAGDRFGDRIELLPDLDGDGDDELMVSSPSWPRTDAARESGAVHIFSGLDLARADGLPTSGLSTQDALLRVEGAENGARLGEVFAGCPDMDGDGRGELLVASPWAQGDSALEGAVALLPSSALLRVEGPLDASTAPWRWTGGGVGWRAGSALSCTHDLIGDPTPDLVIGVPFADAAHEASGQVWILDGAALPASGPLTETGALVLEGPGTDAWAGWSLATGDLDGDGAVDLVVGAPGAPAPRDAGGEAAGLALIYDGAALRRGDPHPRVRVRAAETGDALGRAVAMVDLNVDGYDDVLVGAPRRNPEPDSTAFFDSGAMYVFFGAPRWTSLRPGVDPNDADQTWTQSRQYLRTGQKITVGDVNDDGFPDIALHHRVEPN